MTVFLPVYFAGHKPTIHKNYYDRGNTTMYVTNGSGTNWYALNEIMLTEVKKDDVIDIKDRFQCRNDAGFNTEVAYMITVSDSQLSSSYNNTAPQPFGILTSQQPISGYNVDSVIHYARMNEFADWVVDDDYDDLYITSWVRFRSSSANGSQYFTNQPTQSFMHIKHWR